MRYWLTQLALNAVGFAAGCVLVAILGNPIEVALWGIFAAACGCTVLIALAALLDAAGWQA